VIIWRAYFDRSWPRYIATAGQVVGRDADGVVVKTGDSTLRILEIETDAGVAIPAWPLGTRLDVNRQPIRPEQPGPHDERAFLGVVP
jgi:hypothetical protein